MEDNEPFSHEEIWDDSALINSWNSALNEYKKYHSIHAKGGSLKDLEEAVNSSKSKAPVPLPNESRPQGAQEQVDEEEAAPSSEERVPPAKMVGVSSAPASLPPMGSIKDENLKKLLMSWYYAGYYTGLFEGQQQAKQDDQHPKPQGRTS